MLSKLIAFTSLALVSVAAATDCQPCSDDESPWMIQNYKKCSGSYQVHKTEKCYDEKWNYCQESCSLERDVHPNGVPCCGPPPKPTLRPTKAPTKPAPTPKPDDPSPKDPECKNDEVPFWIQMKPQWVAPHSGSSKKPQPATRRSLAETEERSLSEGYFNGGAYEIHSDFIIKDLCDTESDHPYHHGRGKEIDDATVWWQSSQHNKIALPFCVPKSKIQVCFCYVTGPYWITSELGEADGEPNGHFYPGHPNEPCEKEEDYVCEEPIGECPHYY